MGILLFLPRHRSTRDVSHLVTLISVVVVIGALYFARVVLVPFALAILFAFLLMPLVFWLEKLRVPRTLAVLVVVFVSVGGVAALGWTVTDQLVDVTNQLPNYRANIRKKVQSLRSPKNNKLDQAKDAVTEIGKELSEPAIATSTVPPGGRSLGSSGTPAKPVSVEVVHTITNPLESLNGLISPIGTAGIVIIFTIFMLIRWEDLRNRFIRLAGHGHLNVMTQALDEAGHRVSRYLFLQILVNAVYGVVIGLALHFVGLPNALLWGVTAGLLRFLPYVGPVLSAVLPFLLALAIFDDWKRALIILMLYTFIELIVGNAIEPVLYGQHVGLSSLAVLVSAVFWSVLWGPIGLVLSTPLTVCLVVMGRYVPHLEFLNILFGDEPVLLPQMHFYQRLLASDQPEAKEVLEDYLKEHPLEELYDQVLVPALALAEEDRHSNALDEATEKFITRSTRDLVEELFATADEPEPSSSPSETASGEHELPASHRVRRPSSLSVKIVTLPARDDADEIVATMLSQLLERRGYQSHSVASNTTPEMLAQLDEARPDIVCISALPPFALTNARNLYVKLISRSPSLKVVIGLWGYSGDVTRAASRMRVNEEHNVVVTLAQAIHQIQLYAGSEVASPVASEPVAHLVKPSTQN